MPSAIPTNVQPAIPSRSSLYDPLVLFAETTLATGAAVSPNTAALQNPHGVPMELLAVKFRIHTLNNEGTNSAQSVSGLGVGVKLDMGKIAIVDAGVPVSLMSTARDDGEDSGLGYPVFTTSNLDPDEGDTAFVYDYLWRLKYPLFIPPSAAVTPIFNHLTQTPFDVRVSVTYYCRTFRGSSKMPAIVQVPWVVSYKSKSFDINEGGNPADHDESSELDIRNPFPAGRVEIQRITGRQNFYVSGLQPGNPNSNYEFGANPGFADQVNQHLRVTIHGSRGDDIVRTPTLFGSLFPGVFKTWELGPCWYMYPGEFYDVRLTRDEFVGPLAADSTARMQVAIGVVGYQKINTSTLEGAL
jgi:hypothetical protein